MAERSVALLSLAIRPRLCLVYIGRLCLPMAVLPAVQAVAGLAYAEYDFALRNVLLTVALGGTGLLANRRRARQDLQSNEALAITATTFLLAALTMAWPLGSWGLPFADAFFEAVSGITTTGLSMEAHPGTAHPAFLLCRAWLQWFGGLGIVVLALALVLSPGIAARRLAGESEYEDLVAGAKIRARRLVMVYGSLTLAAFAAILACGASPFDALLHSLSSVSTGGFSSYDDSLAGLDNRPAEIAVSLASLAGAISFSLLFSAWRGGWRKLVLDREVQWLFIATALVAVLLSATMALSGRWQAGEIAGSAPLLAIAAQTTSGFSSLAVSDLDGASKAVLILSMFVGGDMGSTAGGIKLFRLLIVIRLLQLLLVRPALPRHAVADPHIGGRHVQAEEIQAALGVIALYATVAAGSWLVFLCYGVAPLDALFDVVSALGTVGLSSGVTEAGMPLALKLVLCADMLMGRLEIVAFLILLHPRTWFGRRAEA